MKRLPLRCVLSSTSETRSRIQRLRDLTVKSFPTDEREELYSDLTTVAEGYNYGWSDGSDVGEDD